LRRFLELSTDESEYIELKLSLSQALAKRRKQKKLTQAQLAKILKSSQSKVAKIEREIRAFLLTFLSNHCWLWVLIKRVLPKRLHDAS